MGGQGGCDRRIEKFLEIHKKKFRGEGSVFGGGVGGVRVDANEELKFLCKFKKKKFWVGGGVGGGGGGGRGRRVGGVRVDVNEELKFL